MNEQAFLEKRGEDWRRLSVLVDKADGKSLQELSGDELRELVRLYRRTSADLALARTKSRNAYLVDHLNDLVAAAYGVIYRAPRKPILESLVSAAALSAQTVRRNRWFILVSALIFFGSWMFVALVIGPVPEVRDVVVSSEEMEEVFEHWKKGEHQARSGTASVAMQAFYATNNPRVSILTGAIGVATFGFGSIYLLFTNGALIGALSRDTADVGKLDFLLSSIAPHGVPELGGAIVSGAAGLLLGWALVRPGQRRRGEAIKAVGGDAIVLIVTSVALMFVAAPIEAYFSFNPAVPGSAKVLVAAAGLIGWLAFFGFYGRKGEASTALKQTASQ